MMPLGFIVEQIGAYIVNTIDGMFNFMEAEPPIRTRVRSSVRAKTER